MSSATLSKANELAIIKGQTQKLEAKVQEDESALNLAALAQHIDVFEGDHARAHACFQRSSKAASHETSGNGSSSESLSLAFLLHADFLQRVIHERKLDASKGKPAGGVRVEGKQGEIVRGRVTCTICSTLNLKGLLEKAERLYQRALRCDYIHPMARGSYAVFLHMYKRDFDAAEAAYELAIQEEPGHASVLCKVSLV